MIAYASRTGTRRNLAALRRAGWRLLLSPAGVLRTEGFPYALDNGAWSAYCSGTPWNEPAFAAALARFGPGADWVVLPDIVAGGRESLELSARWMCRVLGACARALIAVQDGMESHDVRPLLGPTVGVFVGGTTTWKLATLSGWAALARERRTWCHVGRVNTARRIFACSAAGVDSIDGTSASRFASTLPMLDSARRQRNLFAPGALEMGL